MHLNYLITFCSFGVYRKILPQLLLLLLIIFVWLALYTCISCYPKSPGEPVPLPSVRQHPSYGDCLEVKREYYQICSVLGCVTQCLQSAAHLYEQFLQVQQIGFVTLRPLRHA